jgi:hypothetical protein
MPTNLTGSKVKDTFDQLLHVDGGPAATEKVVYSAAGVSTALKIGTGSVSVDNLRIDGNKIASTNSNGDIVLDPAGSGSVVLHNVEFDDAEQARSALGLGDIATQSADDVAITGGSITGVEFTGSFTGITLIESETFRTVNGGAGLELSAGSIVAAGSDANININLTPKGAGEVNVTNIDVLSGKIPFNTITNRAYAAFYDAGTVDQTGSTTDRTAVKFATASVVGAGVTVASNSRITLAAAGTYRFNTSLQFVNTENSDHEVTIWFAKNGTNIPNSASKIVVPSSSTGGTAVFDVEIFETVAANDYIEVYWYPEDLDVKLHYIAPVAANPGVTPAIPAVPPAIVVVERIA